MTTCRCHAEFILNGSFRFFVDEFTEKFSELERVREEHRLLSSVGQHPARRRILGYIGEGELKSEREISADLELSEWDARYHLAQLCSANLVEELDGKYRVSRLGAGLLPGTGGKGTQDR